MSIAETSAFRIALLVITHVYGGCDDGELNLTL